MTFTIFMASKVKDAPKRLIDLGQAVLQSFSAQIKNIGIGEAIKAGDETAHALIIELADGEEAELGARREAITKALIMRGAKQGFTPLDSGGKVIYIFPEYGFDVVIYSPQTGRHLDLNELVMKEAARYEESFAGHSLAAPEMGDLEGDIYVAKLRFQDYRDAVSRNRLLLTCFFRLGVRLRQAGFAVLDFKVCND